MCSFRVSPMTKQVVGAQGGKLSVAQVSFLIFGKHILNCYLERSTSTFDSRLTLCSTSAPYLPIMSCILTPSLDGDATTLPLVRSSLGERDSHGRHRQRSSLFGRTATSASTFVDSKSSWHTHFLSEKVGKLGCPPAGCRNARTTEGVKVSTCSCGHPLIFSRSNSSSISLSPKPYFDLFLTRMLRQKTDPTSK